MNISWNNVFSFKVVCILKETGLLLPHAVLRQFPVNFLQTKLGDRSVKKKKKKKLSHANLLFKRHSNALLLVSSVSLATVLHKMESIAPSKDHYHS